MRAVFISLILNVALLANANGNNYCKVYSGGKIIINVREQGAKGDGVTDDTKALQRAIDQASAVYGVVEIPDGIYIVDAEVGVRLKSDVVLKLSGSAIIKARPNNVAHYSILKLENISNVEIIGGVLLGEKDNHQGTSGEWGMGMSLVAVKNIVIKNVVSKNNWGDGFYISGDSNNIKFCSVVANGNRRQGMSIVSGENILVIDSSFINTSGTPPQAGIDIEPNENQMVRNVKILNSKFLNNSGAGIASYVPQYAKESSVSNVEIRANVIAENKTSGVSIFNTSLFRIIENNLINNKGNSIYLDNKTRAGLIIGNEIHRGDVFDRNRIVDDGVNSVSGNYLY